MSADAFVEVANVTASYGPHTVLRDVSLRMARTEIVALLGHNGAGKSTLVHAIAGVMPLDSGSVRIDDRDQAAFDAAQRARSGVSLVPQGRGIFPSLSIADNLELGAGVGRSVHGRTPIERSLVLELFPALKHRLNERAGNLSGGQQQMVAIGTALMANPSLLLLDEPSTGLAPVLVQDLFTQIKEVAKDLNLSVLIVEQNIPQTLRIADRCYVLRLGEIVRESNANVLLEDPEIWDLF